MEVCAGISILLFAVLIVWPALRGALQAGERAREAGLEPPPMLELGIYSWLAFLLAFLLTAVVVILIGPEDVSRWFRQLLP